MLLDIWMPDTDGVTLLKEWGATGLLTMPVIMMSGHAHDRHRGRGDQVSARMAFLEKPITLQKLLQGGRAGPGASRRRAGRGASAGAGTRRVADAAASRSRRR